jgi:hypothetical protein
MKSRAAYACVVLGVLLLGAAFTGFAQDKPSEGRLLYEVTARNPYLVRQVGENVSEEVQGVPAEPVHSFSWSGEGVTQVEGEARLRVDPVSNTGTFVAAWEDRNGTWRVEQQAFAVPSGAYLSGIRLGSSAEDVDALKGDPVVNTVYMHGATGAVDPALPTLFAYVATWGPAKVTLDGEVFENPFDGPSPDWMLHTMTISGVYGDQGEVLGMEEGEQYDPESPGEGITRYSDLEFQFIFIDAPGEADSESFPPNVDFAYHLVFEDVRVEITQAE